MAPCIRPCVLAVVGTAAILAGVAHTSAEEPPAVPAVVRGKVVHAATLEPLADATVRLEETGAETKTGPDGTFTVAGLRPGTYHLLVSAPRYVPHRTEVQVSVTAESVEVRLSPELHFSEVVSVSPTARDQFDAYQPTSVLAGQDLSINLGATLASTLETQPGIAERSLGPAPARPVIRGLDGDRVLILEDGQRVGDLSSQSADHGVLINPAAASRVEIVRGPATLLYGANAIGGLVNVVNESIPVRPVTAISGQAVLDYGSGAQEGGAAADLLVGRGRWALRAGGSGRGSDDMSTPDGEVANSQSRSGLGSLALSLTGQRGFLGAGYEYNDSRYGIPVVEEGQVELTPRRHAVSVRGQARQLDALFTSVRGSYAYRRYRHDEVVAGDIETQFSNDTNEFDVLANHRDIGRLSGTVGCWGLVRAFDAVGEEALSPPVDQRGASLFVYEELTWPHVTFQFGGRYDHASFRPERDRPDRSFDNFSGSVGLLVRPTETTTVAVSLARASRHPALEELYYFGPHPGNFAFEIGNPQLESEVGVGFDVSFRWRLARLSGEATYFRNDIRNYIFRNPISEEEFDERFGHDEEAGEGEHDHGEGLPIIEYVSADSVLQGFEFHTDIELVRSLVAELQMDYVRGELSEADEPLPRIPPFHFLGGLRYQWNAFQAGGRIVAAARQDRVFGEELPTDGYGRLNLYGAYSFQSGRALSTITARLDNATNELYRNHLSYIKDLVPEMGRSVRLIYSVKF